MLLINRGFTLIEMVIYVALFAILIGGLMATAQGLWQSAGDTSLKLNVAEEINFVTKKLSWALTGVGLVNLPAPDKVYIKSNFHTYAFILEDEQIKFCKNDPCFNPDDFYPITTRNVSISAVNFDYDSDTRLFTADITVDGVETTFTKFLRI